MAKTETIKLEDDLKAEWKDSVISITGPNGTATKKLATTVVKISLKDSEVTLTYTKNNKMEKKIGGSLRAHINNLQKGALEGHKYTLKICSGHFPMNVSVNGNELTIKNYFGGKVPRTVQIPYDVKVTIDGENIHVESSNKESAGTFASLVEKTTSRSNFDKRIFQDGIYITSRGGKEIK